MTLEMSKRKRIRMRLSGIPATGLSERKVLLGEGRVV